MSIYRVRKENLRALIEKWGGPTTLAKKLGHSNPSYLSQLTGPQASRQISEKTARKLEDVLSLKAGWLDVDHSKDIPTSQLDNGEVNPDRLAECIELVTALCEKLTVKPSPAKYADLVALAYQDKRPAEEVRQYLTRIIRLMS